MSSQKLSRDLRLLLIFSALRNVTDLFLGTFLISFLMQNSLNEILSVSTYKLFEYAATCAGFFIFAHWCKRYNKVAVFALNQVPKIALLAAIILLLTNGCKVTKKWHPIVFIVFSAVVGIVFGFAGS